MSETKHSKTWSVEDKKKLIKRVGNSMDAGTIKQVGRKFLNEEFNRRCSDNTWRKRIEKTRREYFQCSECLKVFSCKTMMGLAHICGDCWRKTHSRKTPKDGWYVLAVDELCPVCREDGNGDRVHQVLNVSGEPSKCEKKRDTGFEETPSTESEKDKHIKRLEAKVRVMRDDICKRDSDAGDLQEDITELKKVLQEKEDTIAGLLLRLDGTKDLHQELGMLHPVVVL